jgi:type IV secretory pathway TrbF-like protein
MRKNSLALANAASMHPLGDEDMNPLAPKNSPTAVYKRRIRNQYRIIAGGLACLALSLYGNMFGSVRVKYYPFILERSAQGELKPISTFPHETPVIRLPDIEVATKELIWNLRRVGIDEKMHGDQWKKAQAYMSTRVASMMAPFVNEQRARIKKGEAVDIKITSFLPVPGSDNRVVEIEWEETPVSRNGMLVNPPGVQQWKAIIQVAVIIPKAVENPVELKNPLGIFVTDYTWGVKNNKGK